MKLGCVAGAGLDYVQLGIQTGKMAAKVLTGEATCQDLPYEIIENYSLYINSSAIAEMNLTLPGRHRPDRRRGGRERLIRAVRWQNRRK